MVTQEPDKDNLTKTGWEWEKMPLEPTYDIFLLCIAVSTLKDKKIEAVLLWQTISTCKNQLCYCTLDLVYKTLFCVNSCCYFLTQK